MKHAGVRQTAGKSPHGTHAYGRATHPDHRLPCPSAVCLLPGATRCGMSTGAGCPTWPALWSLCCATPPVLPLLAPPGMPAPVVRDEEPSSDTLGLAHGRRRSAAAALSRVHLCLCWIADLVSGGVRCQRPWKALHEGISIIQGPCLHRAHTTRSYTACTNAYGQAGAPDHEHQAPSTKLHRPRNAHEGMSPVQHAGVGPRHAARAPILAMAGRPGIHLLSEFTAAPKPGWLPEPAATASVAETACVPSNTQHHATQGGGGGGATTPTFAS